MTAAALLTLALVALGGILVGGAISVVRQHGPRVAVAGLALAGAAALGLAAVLLVRNAR